MITSSMKTKLCSTKMKTLKKYCQRVLVITSLALFINEFLVYYIVLLSCKYPPAPPGGHPVGAMILADTHLLGRRNGHWFDKLRREWQMHRTFQTAQTLFAPEHVFFLGDLFDEGKWCPPQEFDYYVRRFQSLFSVDEAKTKIHVMAGNHDIGFHYSVTPYLDKRFKDAFKTEAVEYKVINEVPFVIINSMALEGDGCFLCKSAIQNLKKVKGQLKNNNGSKMENTRPILMSHFPLYRLSDDHCDEPDDAPAAEKAVQFREGWDCISKESSGMLLEDLNPRLIFSGHTHHGCNTSHGDAAEISVSSFSWRNKKKPAFVLAYFTKDSHAIAKCYMPEENNIYCAYVFFISLMLFSMFKK
eukprot:GFUD01007659.1.p1 GENE.GFUD01007659.1~~GFUD01007659.1.p1  ORF type:complete len:358 (-),score=59.39 GFUD01007659.1:8-1081(-)